MEYTCLKKIGKGFIITRKPEILNDGLIISFKNAPTSATIILRNQKGNSLYRSLIDSSCEIPLDFLKGEISVLLTVLNGKSNTEKYICEPFFVEEKNGVIMVYPNWLDLPMQIIDIYGELQSVKGGMEELFGKFDSLDKKVDKLLDGYDFD